MYAVIRETFYPPEIEITEEDSFKEFQKIHADQKGYLGTLITSPERGRYYTITLWSTKNDMDNARTKLGSAVEEFLKPFMSAPAKLLDAGPVLINDLVKDQSD